jgi:hypothetical protein
MRQTAKAAGDAVGAAVAKSLAVSLWGQFAARLSRYVSTSEVPAPPGMEYGAFDWLRYGGRVPCRVIAGQVDRLEERAEPTDAMPSVAAFVATNARTYMDGLKTLIGAENVVYQCADSLHVTDSGLRAALLADLVRPGVMGALKIVRTVRRPVYLAANTHILDGELTAAGIYGRAEEISPGKFRWRLPSRLLQTCLVPPSGLVDCPEVTRTVSGLAEARGQ